MNRRYFLTNSGIASVAVATGSLRTDTASAQSLCSSNPGYHSVHASSLRIVSEHLARLQANPKHNPFASGDVAAAYRMHCDSLEATGHNASITSFHRNSPLVQLKESHITPHFETLSKLGVSIDPKIQSVLTSKLLSASSSVLPAVHQTLQTTTFLKHQKATHLQLNVMHAALAAKPRAAVANVSFGMDRPHLIRSSFHPPRLHAFQDATQDPTSGTWSSSDSIDCVADDSGGGVNLIFMGGGGNNLIASSGLTDFSWSSFGLPEDYTTPSGVHISWCTLGNAILALCAGGIAAVAGWVALNTETVILAGVAFNPAALAVIFGLLAAYWAYWAIVC